VQRMRCGATRARVRSSDRSFSSVSALIQMTAKRKRTGERKAEELRIHLVSLLGSCTATFCVWPPPLSVEIKLLAKGLWSDTDVRRQSSDA